MDSTSAAGPYRDLLAAIRDAIDLPLPAADADHQSFDWLQRDRGRAALSVIDAILKDPECAGCVEAATEVLRERIAQLPITYRPYESARPEGGNLKLLPPELQVAPSLTGREAADVR